MKELQFRGKFLGNVTSRLQTSNVPFMSLSPVISPAERENKLHERNSYLLHGYVKATRIQ